MAGSLGNYLIGVMIFSRYKVLLEDLDSVVTIATRHGLLDSVLGARWGQEFFCKNSGFHREVDENCALLGFYAACSDNSVLTFRDNLMGPIFQGREFLVGYPETSMRNYHYMMRNSPEERSSQEIFCSPYTSRTIVGSTQSPLQWILGILPRE